MQVRTPNISGNDPRAWADLKRWCGNVAAALRELHSAVHKPTVMFGGNVVVRRWSEGDSTSSWRVQAGAIFISGVEKLPVRYSDDAAYARGDWAEIRDDASDLETDEFTVYLAYSASGDKAYYTTDETDEDIAYPIASWNGSNMTPHVGGDVTHSANLVCKLKFYDDDEDEWSATHDDSATARWVPFAIYTPDDNPLATGQDVPDGEDWHCFKQQSMPSYEISSTGWQGSWAVLNFDIEVHYDASMDNWKSTGFGSTYPDGLIAWDSTEGKWRVDVADGSWGTVLGRTSRMRSDAMPPEGNYPPSASLLESASSPSAMLTVTKL